MRTLVKRSGPVTEIKDLFGAETKVLDKAAGIVEAIVSVTGIDDEVDDVITPGAYRKTLAARIPKGIRSHDWDRPAMKTLNSDELLPGDEKLPAKTNRGEPWPRAAGALKILMQWNLETKDGSEGFSNVGFYGPEQEWSIGYNVQRGAARMVKGTRHLDVMDLFEYSDVLFGAMPLAGTQNIKAHGGMVITGGLWTPGGYEKALPGSDQERDQMLEQALNEAFRAEYPEDDRGMMAGYQMIRGTFSDRVVVCFHHGDDRQDWEYAYTIEGEEVVLGDRRAVKIEESLIPDDNPDDTEAAEPVEAGETKHEDIAAMLAEQEAAWATLG